MTRREWAQMVVDFERLSIEDQYRFLAHLKLPKDIKSVRRTKHGSNYLEPLV